MPWGIQKFLNILRLVCSPEIVFRTLLISGRSFQVETIKRAWRKKTGVIMGINPKNTLIFPWWAMGLPWVREQVKVGRSRDYSFVNFCNVRAKLASGNKMEANIKDNTARTRLQPRKWRISGRRSFASPMCQRPQSIWKCKRGAGELIWDYVKYILI